MYSNELCLDIPGLGIQIHPGDEIKLGRFAKTVWRAEHGWFTFGGNRPFCGWYLIDVENPNVIKPLQLPDLTDCYLVRS